jgi:S-adenosylmethionine decarboxylase proenzyme
VGVGKEILADLIGCNSKLLRDKKYVEKVLVESAKLGKAEIIGKEFYKFSTKGMGVTGYVLIAESHISFHSWPEFELAAIDIFTCGNADIDAIFRNIKKGFSSKTVKVKRITRGEI